MAAITPDRRDVLARFAAEHAIRYPLLSDEGGLVVERFGVLNPNIPENHRQAPGIPFPGHFLLAPDGSVTAKAFTGDLRHRASGSTLVFEQLGRAGQPEIHVETPELVATVVPSTSRLFGGQEAAMLVELRVARGWHVYGPGVGSPYQGVAVQLEPDGPDLVAEQSFDLPPSPLRRVGVLEATLPTYEGTVAIRGRFRLRWSPPPSLFPGLEDAVARRAIPPGAYRLPAVLRYQACDDTTCLPPRTVEFHVPIEVEATVERPA